MNLDNSNTAPPRLLTDAEGYTPPLLQDFILKLEQTSRSSDVWKLLVQLGRGLELPYVDFISASSFTDWRKTLFVRTSYDSSWLTEANSDPEIQKWSYFRSHAMHYLTPILVGIEFVDEYRHIPAKRVEVLEQAADHGIRSGLSIPLRHNAPPQAGLITFSGSMNKAEMTKLVSDHGWTLNSAALMGHQRYLLHFGQEFSERNHITDKQQQLLQMIGMGMPDKKIAGELEISVSAVRQRMNALLHKTGLHNRAELAALAMRLGILPDPLNSPDRPEVETLVEMDPDGAHRRIPR